MGLPSLSRRERQIMDILHREGEATAADVRAALPDAPSYSAVRALLRILEEKGHLTHTQEGPRYVYQPTMAPEKAQRSALRHLLDTFFDDSAERAVAALLDLKGDQLSQADLDRLTRLIDQAKKDER